MNGFQSNADLPHDGLITPTIGRWGERKYLLVSNYSQIFANSMKRKWDCRVYLDLFAGAGRSQIEGTSRIVLASPLLALEITDKFDLYVFCEKDETKMDALIKRIQRDYSDMKVEYVSGDSNQHVNEILLKIPRAQKGFRVLTFCFADPYNLKSLHFSTVQALSQRFVDFLILIPSGMDAIRNLETHYLNPENITIDDFLGTSEWRCEWQKIFPRQSVDVFLTNYYGKKMEQLGYHYPDIESTQLIRSTEKNLPLYRLALFSRAKLGERFWKETRKYSDPQLTLFG
jgi:three-Cys-motif partner protein